MNRPAQFIARFPSEQFRRRVSCRKRIQLEVELHPLLDESRNLWKSSVRHATTLDLSEQGMLLSRSGYLPVGGVVRIVFKLPDRPHDPVSSCSRVVRCEVRGRPSYGLKFLDLSPAVACRIRRLNANSAW